MGRSPAEHQVIEILLAEFVLRHDLPEQMVVLTNQKIYQQFRFVVKHMLVGILLQVSHKTSVVSQLLKQQFLASDKRVLDVDNHTNIPMLHVGLILPEMRGVLASDGRCHAVDHPTQWLIEGTGT